MRTLLTIDDERPASERWISTHDGFKVHVASNPDLLGEAGYAGSPLQGIDALCGGLLDESFEDHCALPRTPINEDERMQSLPHARRFARGMRPPAPNIAAAKLRYLLSRKWRAAVPLSRIAEMASRIERQNAAIQHEEVLLDGMLSVVVTVHQGQTPVVQRTLCGVPTGNVGNKVISRFVCEVIEEARELAGGLRHVFR